MSGNPENVNVGMSTRDKFFLFLCMRLSLCNIHFTRNRTFVLSLVPHACIPSNSMFNRFLIRKNDITIKLSSIWPVTEKSAMIVGKLIRC